MLPFPPSSEESMLSTSALAGRNFMIVAAPDRLQLAGATAQAFIKAGAQVAYVSSDLPQGALLAGCRSFVIEAYTAAAVSALITTIEADLGALDGLIYLPAHPTPAVGEDIDLDNWHRHTKAPLDLAFLLYSALARCWSARGSAGSIVQAIDNAAWQGSPGQAHGSCLSAALQSLGKTLSVEWARRNIRVNSVVPGPFAGDTDLARRLVSHQGRALEDSLPAQRLGQPQEFGWAVSFLSSPYAAYITGATLIIDGGNHLRRSISAPPFKEITDWLHPTHAGDIA